MKKFLMATCMVSTIFLLLVQCKSSYITHTWKYEKSISKKYKRILVICLMNRDMYLREQMEDHLVQDLNTRNITAISALSAYGPKFFKNKDEDSILNLLQHSGIDGVLTIALLDKEKERYYVPGRVYYTPYMVYHRRFWGYYNTIYDRIYEPGYYEISTNYFWESNFYDLSEKQLVYSIQTKSFDGQAEENMAHQFGKVICSELMDKHVIQ